LNELNGTTVISNGSKYFFIIDDENHRIIVSNQLVLIVLENIFIVDEDNNRIEKFTLLSNSNSTLNLLNVSYNQPTVDPFVIWNLNGIIFTDLNAIDFYYK